jgi:hypothetical protein
LRLIAHSSGQLTAKKGEVEAEKYPKNDSYQKDSLGTKLATMGVNNA